MSNISGIDKLQRYVQDAQRWAASLNGMIGEFKFNPDDPESVQEAIRQMEAAVDSKSAAHRDNPIIVKTAQAFKDKCRENFLSRAKVGQA